MLTDFSQYFLKINDGTIIQLNVSQQVPSLQKYRFRTDTKKTEPFAFLALVSYKKPLCKKREERYNEAIPLFALPQLLFVFSQAC
jgi:hypothetical protein